MQEFIQKKKSYNFFSIFFVTAMIVAQTSAAQQQKFKVTPHDLQVLEGSEAVLRCEVSNLAGQVQWTKDGFALGKCFKPIHFILKCRIILSCKVTMVVILSFALRNAKP